MLNNAALSEGSGGPFEFESEEAEDEREMVAESFGCAMGRKEKSCVLTDFELKGQVKLALSCS